MLLCIISFAFLLMAVNTPRQTHFDMLWIGPHTASPTLDVDPNDVYIHGDVETGRDAKIGRDISVGDDITITDDATVGDDLAVIGDTTNTGTITGTKGIRAADPNNSTTRYIEIDNDGTQSIIKTKYGDIVIQDPNGDTLATINSTGGIDNNDNNITNVGEVHLDTLMSDANAGVSFNDENITNVGEIHLDTIMSDANAGVSFNDENIINAGEVHLDSIHADANTTITISDSISVTGNVGATTYGSDSSISDAELLTLDNGATTEILVGGGAGSAPVWTIATGTGAPVRAGSPTFTTSINLSDGNLINVNEAHVTSLHSDGNTTIPVSDPINVSGQVKGTSIDAGDGAATNFGDVHLDNIYSDQNATITTYDDFTIDPNKTLTATEYTFGKTRSLNQYASITAAITDTANWTVLVATEAYTCPNSAITIASGDTLQILPGAILTPCSNTTLTFASGSNFEAGDYQCFADRGDGGNWVSFGAGSINEFHPEWRGFSTSGSRATNTTALQKSITLCITDDIPLQLSPGTFNVNNGSISIPNNSTGFVMRGSSQRNGTIIDGQGVGNTLTLAHAQYNVIISDMTISGDPNTDACIDSQAQLVQFKNLTLKSAKKGLNIPDNTSRAAIYIEHCHIRNNTQYGIYLASGAGAATAVHMHNNWISDNGVNSTHYGVYIHGGYCITFKDNVLERDPNAKGAGLALAGGASSIVVSGNECEDVGFEIGNSGNSINGVTINNNYMEGSPYGAAAFIINRADTLVAFGNDFGDLTAGKYGYSFTSSVTNGQIGPDECDTNYYTGTIGANSLIYGTSSGSDIDSWTANIDITGSLETKTRLAVDGTYSAGHILTIPAIISADPNDGTYSLDLDTGSSAYPVCYVDVKLAGRFNSDSALGITKHWGVHAALSSDVLQDKEVSELASLGDAKKANLSMDIAAKGSDNEITFTWTNADPNDAFAGRAIFTVVPYQLYDPSLSVP